MSDANRTAVGLVEEVTPGTTPPNPVFENLRIKASNLAYKKQTVLSAELRIDRQITDIPTVGFDGGGDIPMEFSYGAMDSSFRAMAMAEWVFTPVRKNTAPANNITSVSATNFIMAAATLVETNSGAFAPGHLIRTSGFTGAGNNRQFRAAAGTIAANITTAGNTVDAAPVTGARVKCIGFEGAAADITAAVGGLGSTALDFTTLGLAIGQWVYIGGAAAGQKFATAANTGWARISAAPTATVLPLDNLPVGWGVDAGAGKTIRVFTGDYIRNGVTKRTYSLENQFADMGPLYELYTGMTCESISLSIQARSIVEAGVSWMGLTMTSSAVRFVGATDLVAPTFDVLNATSNVGQLYENGVALAGANYVVGANIQFKNQLRRNNAVGSLSSSAIGIGRIIVDGQLNTYFGDATLRNKVLLSSSSSFSTAIVDPSGPRGYMIDLPKIKFPDGDPTVPGVDTDRMLNAKIQALRHPTFGYTFQIQRFEEYGT